FGFWRVMAGPAGWPQRPKREYRYGERRDETEDGPLSVEWIKLDAVITTALEQVSGGGWRPLTESGSTLRTPPTPFVLRESGGDSGRLAQSTQEWTCLGISHRVRSHTRRSRCSTVPLP